MDLDRKTVAELVAGRIAEDCDNLRAGWESSKPVRHIVVDDLLPAEVARLLSQSFPRPETLMLRSSIR